MNNLQEFREFMSDNKASDELPLALKNQVAQKIILFLTPNLPLLLVKLLTIHLFMSLITIASCPQFGIVLWAQDSFVLSALHHVGPIWCSLICGIYFFFLTGMMMKLILTNQDYRALHQHRFVFFPMMVGLTLISFAIFGSALFELLTIVWAMGGLTVLFSFDFFHTLSWRPSLIKNN